MSTIHYKFHSCVTYTTITFDDLHVRVNELKKAIYEKENLAPEQFDLLVENAHTKRVYSDDHIVPRNSSVIVRRCPRENTKAPKVHDQSTSGIVGKAPQQAAPDLSFIDSIDFSKMTEQERLAHVKKVSSEKYAQQNFRRTTNANAFSEPPPPNYTCNRCSRTGHWYRDCPLVNVRRTTGIPMEELVETTADDPHAMLHPSGKFMVQRMHMAARITSKAKHPQIGLTSSPNIDETGQSPRYQEEPIPEELQCPLCKELLKEAVLTVCCGQSFCMSCMMQVIMSENPRCPGQDCSAEINNNSIVENKQLRRAVEKYRLSKGQPIQKPVNMDAIVSTLSLPLVATVDSSLVDDAQEKSSSLFPRTNIGFQNRSGTTPTSQTNGNSIMNINPTLNTVASTNSQPVKLPTVDLTKMLPTSKPVIQPAQPLVNNATSISTPTIDHKAPKARPNLDDTAPPGTFEASDVENAGDAREREEKKKNNDISKLWESLLQRDEPSNATSKSNKSNPKLPLADKKPRERQDTASSSSSDKKPTKKRTPSPESEAKNAALSALLGVSDKITEKIAPLGGGSVIDPVTGRPTLGGASKSSSRPRRRSKSPLATRRSNRSRSPRGSKRKPERQREEPKKDRNSRRRRSRSPASRRRSDKSKSPRKRSHRRKRSRTPEKRDRERKETSKKKSERRESEPKTPKDSEFVKSDSPTKLTAEENEIDNVIQETKEKLRTFSATTSDTEKSSPSEKAEIPPEKAEEVFEKDEEMELEKHEEEEKELEKPHKKVASPKFIDETKLIDSFRPVEEIEKENGNENPKEEPKHHDYENEIALEEEEDDEMGHSSQSDHENNNGDGKDSDSSDSSVDEKRRKKEVRNSSKEERKSDKKKKKKHKKHHKDDREHKKKKKREKEEKSTESRKRRRSSSDSDDEGVKKKKKKHKKRDK